MAKIAPLIDYLAEDYPESPKFVSSVSSSTAPHQASTSSVVPHTRDCANETPRTHQACWADDLKAQGVYANADWHYINLPYVRKALFAATPPIENVTNVAWALGEAQSAIRSDRSKKIDKVFRSQQRRNCFVVADVVDCMWVVRHACCGSHCTLEVQYHCCCASFPLCS